MILSMTVHGSREADKLRLKMIKAGIPDKQVKINFNTVEIHLDSFKEITDAQFKNFLKQE